MPALVASLDHVAIVRDKRKANDPDPVAAALVAEMAGASAISVQLRGDRRFIQERDVRLLREVVKTRLHLALAPTNDSIKLAYAVKPHMVTLVPERQEEVSSSIGLDVLLNQAHVKKVVRALREIGVRVAILIDPEADQVKAAHACETDAVMLNARLYADTAREKEAGEELERFAGAAKMAHKHRMRVFAGHGLDYANIAAIARIPEIEACEVGHALVARSLFSGLDAAVRELRARMQPGLPPPSQG